MVEDMDKAAATATTVPLFCQTYLGMTITSTCASRFCDFKTYFEICCMF